MGQQPLPGLRAQYRFVPAGDAVGLRVVVEFDPAEPADRESVLKACGELCGHLAGEAEGKPPVDVTLVTSVAPKPVASTAEGVPLSEAIIRFVGAIPGSLQEGAPVPSPLELVFELDGLEAADPPGDLFELSVLLDLGADTLVASPGLAAEADSDPAAALEDFAVDFEQAWDGYDGGGGVLKLAADLETVPPGLWCVRAGSGKGMSLAIAPSGGTLYHAVPPLSRVLLDGSVDDADGAGSRERFSSVDLDLMWAAFAGELERSAEPELAEAILGVSEAAADRLALARQAIAGALAARLAPLAAGAPDEEALKAARAVLEEAALATPGCRSPVAAVAVAVGSGATAPGDPVTRLRGRAVTPSEGAGSEGAGSEGAGEAPGSPAAVIVRAGQQWLAFVAPAAPEGSVEHRFGTRFEGLWLDRSGRALRLLLPDRASPGGSNPLQLDLGARTAPVPLIAAPPIPALSLSAVGGPAEAATIAEALVWTLAVETAPPPAQDRLELVVTFDPVEASPAPPPVARPEDLFGALVRAVRSLSADPLRDDRLDAAKLARFADLASNVAEALARWQAPVPDEAALPDGWRYDIERADPPALTVTRRGARPEALPPWPVLPGYAARPASETVARYEPEAELADAGRLQILVSGPRLPGTPRARVHARIRRNGGLGGPPGVNPDFVYVGPQSATEPASPRIEWQARLPEQPAPTLGSALEALFAPIAPETAGGYAIGVEADLVQPLGAGGMETRVPLLLRPVVAIGSGPGATGLATYRAQLAEALAECGTRLKADRTGAELGLTIALYDDAEGAEPLARLKVRLPAPEPAWWTAATSRRA
jgi:hypothetical protein